MAYRKNADLLAENHDLKQQIADLQADHAIQLSDIEGLTEQARALTKEVDRLSKVSDELRYALGLRLDQIDSLELELDDAKRGAASAGDFKTALTYLVIALENSWLRHFSAGAREAIDTGRLVLDSHPDKGDDE